MFLIKPGDIVQVHNKWDVLIKIGKKHTGKTINIYWSLALEIVLVWMWETLYKIMDLVFKSRVSTVKQFILLQSTNARHAEYM